MDGMSEISASRSLELTEPNAIKILLCYLLKKLDHPMTPEQLYEIAVGNDILNYFDFSGAMDSLLKNRCMKLGGGEYQLTDKGLVLASQFQQYVPKSFRDKLLVCALKYFARLKRENEVTCRCAEKDNGCTVECQIRDPAAGELLHLHLYAPDMEQARVLQNKIMSNPTGFYGRIMGYALDLVEEEPQIED